jgi:hypothetical protein
MIEDVGSRLKLDFSLFSKSRKYLTEMFDGKILTEKFPDQFYGFFLFAEIVKSDNFFKT